MHILAYLIYNLSYWFLKTDFQLYTSDLAISFLNQLACGQNLILCV